MKKIIYLILCIFTSCTYKTGIFRDIAPVPRIDTTIDNSFAMIRTIYADIYIRYVNEETFNELSKQKCFRIENTEKIDIPLSKPEFELFQIIVKNKSNYNISNIETKIIIKDRSIEPVSKESISKNKTYTSYRNIDMLKLFKYRRIISQKPDINNFDKYTFEYDFNIIQKSDSICFFRGFGLHSDNSKNIKFEIAFECDKRKKVIDFDYKKIEYRHDSDEFIRYKLKKDNKNQKESNLWL